MKPGYKATYIDIPRHIRLADKMCQLVMEIENNTYLKQFLYNSTYMRGYGINLKTSQN